MQTTTLESSIGRAAQLHAIVRAYVEEGLGKKNFEAIPYAESVSLRAPLCPGGSTNPLVGKESLRTIWWPPLPQLVGGVRVLNTYVSGDLNSVAVEFHCDIISPACTLRILDRFAVDAEGQIQEQENFFDPRDVTTPGWRGS